MADHDQDQGQGGGDDPSRPSFSDFWKKSKEALGARKIRFVESNPGGGSGGGGSSGASGELEWTGSPVVCLSC